MKYSSKVHAHHLDVRMMLCCCILDRVKVGGLLTSSASFGKLDLPRTEHLKRVRARSLHEEQATNSHLDGL